MRKLQIIKQMAVVMSLFGIMLFTASCNKDVCKDVVCQNGGTETEVSDACVCDCETGFEGERCETQTSTRYVGNWGGTEICSPSGSASYNASIASSSTNPERILISNFGGYGTNITVYANVNGNELTIPSQVVGGSTFSGSGSINAASNSISLNYTATDGVLSDSCQTTLTKQ